MVKKVGSHSIKSIHKVSQSHVVQVFTVDPLSIFFAITHFPKSNQLIMRLTLRYSTLLNLQPKEDRRFQNAYPVSPLSPKVTIN